jgi:hypothetical protein
MVRAWRNERRHSLAFFKDETTGAFGAGSQLAVDKV